ncbi:MAG: cystathionine gamma-synthase [Ignavibacteriales bacterium CG_4_9_14_3_um_filter_34_10]|nr:MAG: cystathionine gamma-synthase [Ignavibacteriales bacterium CG_4_9_14_3_um_filter_34_10]
MGFSTDAIHAGQTPDKATNAVIPPIYMTYTYAQEEFGGNQEYHYGRSQNMTRNILEQNIAVLEDGKYALAFSSGVAAIHSLTGILKSGDHVIVSDNVYGGTYRLFDKSLSQFGITFSWIDFDDLLSVEKAITLQTKILFIETPTNPLLNLIDINRVSELAHKHNLLCVVDNTFMTPFFQKPLNLGADVVIHSSTKYLNGHSDVIGGLVVMNDKVVFDKIKFVQNSIGAIPSPFDCWLVLRSIKTLAVRMKQHNKNALQIAKILSSNKNIKKIIYPGLETHPQHELAKEQMTGFGGIITIELNDFEKTKSFLNKLKIFTLAESLGGVESLVNHSATMTHASLSNEGRLKIGITDSLIRISVGIEDVEDLIQDLNQALK